MTDEPDNIILQYLRRFDERQTHFEDAMQDLKVRMSSIEVQVTELRADMTHVLHRTAWTNACCASSAVSIWSRPDRKTGWPGKAGS